MMKPRVSQLLSDARATVNKPMRPETPREFQRLPSRRLSAMLPPMRPSTAERDAANLSPASGPESPVDPSPSPSPLSLLDAAEVLKSATTNEAAKMALLHQIAKDIRIVKPSDEEAVLLLLTAATAVAVSHTSSLELSLRAASVACRVCLSATSSAFSTSLATAIEVLFRHSAAAGGSGCGAVLKREQVLDPLIQLIRLPNYGWTRDMISMAVGVLRYASSEGGEVLTHLATLGLLAATNNLTQRVLPTFDQEILSHCATIYRNFSVEYSHHFVKLQSLPLVIEMMRVAVEQGFKEVVSSLSRALAKLVFDQDCVQWLVAPPPQNVRNKEEGHNVSVLVDAVIAFSTSRMIVARLCTVLHLILEADESLSTLERLCNNEATAEGLVDVLNTVLTSDKDDKTAEEATQSALRLFGTLTLCRAGGLYFTRQCTPAVVRYLHDKDLANACLTPVQRDSILIALMCLSNMSYYLPQVYPEDMLAKIVIPEELGPMVAGLLFSNDVEAMVEATRVLGNLSSTTSGRDWIEANRCDEVCLVLLQHEDMRLVYNSFGVILNLTAADRCRIVTDGALCAQLLEHTGRFHTLDLSEDPDSVPAQLSSLVEKILLNLTDLVG